MLAELRGFDPYGPFRVEAGLRRVFNVTTHVDYALADLISSHTWLGVVSIKQLKPCNQFCDPIVYMKQQDVRNWAETRDPYAVSARQFVKGE